MSERKGYPSDLTDERWALIEPVITAWKAIRPSVSGHRGHYPMREIVNAIRVFILKLLAKRLVWRARGVLFLVEGHDRWT